jgi:hypothetical protein
MLVLIIVAAGEGTGEIGLVAFTARISSSCFLLHIYSSLTCIPSRNMADAANPSSKRPHSAVDADENGETCPSAQPDMDTDLVNH